MKLLLLLALPQLAFCSLFLKDALQNAHTGDYVVTRQGKTFTVMLIQDKTDTTLAVQEICAPTTAVQSNFRAWVNNSAKGNTSWVQYQLDTKTGTMKNLYSFTKKSACDPQAAGQFLSTLINLPFNEVPLKERKLKGNAKKTANPTQDQLWQPQMIVDGIEIKGVTFNAYKAVWPQDNSDLSGKEILVYLPQDPHYLSYFPQWLQVSGQLEKAKIRICDSGKNLYAPQPL